MEISRRDLGKGVAACAGASLLPAIVAPDVLEGLWVATIAGGEIQPFRDARAASELIRRALAIYLENHPSFSGTRFLVRVAPLPLGIGVAPPKNWRPRTAVSIVPFQG